MTARQWPDAAKGQQKLNEMKGELFLFTPLFLCPRDHYLTSAN